eukprot:1158907-Pelagomonas_calceolata.AAC.2
MHVIFSMPPMLMSFPPPLCRQDWCDLLLDALQQFSLATASAQQQEEEEACSRGHTLQWVLCIRLLLSNALCASTAIMQVCADSSLMGTCCGSAICA